MIDEEIIQILTAAYNKACDILKEHNTELEKIAEELLKHEEIDRNVIKRL